MEEILHQSIPRMSHVSLVFLIHPNWLAGFLKHERYEMLVGQYFFSWTRLVLDALLEENDSAFG